MICVNTVVSFSNFFVYFAFYIITFVALDTVIFVLEIFRGKVGPLLSFFHFLGWVCFGRSTHYYFVTKLCLACGWYSTHTPLLFFLVVDLSWTWQPPGKISCPWEVLWQYWWSRLLHRSFYSVTCWKKWVDRKQPILASLQVRHVLLFSFSIRNSLCSLPKALIIYRYYAIEQVQPLDMGI